MPLTKQAKILSTAQQTTVLRYLECTRSPDRNITIFLLSIDAGLRSKEIAELRWSMILDAQGVVSHDIRLEDSASKGKSGGIIPISRRLHKQLVVLSATSKDGYVIKSQRSTHMTSSSVTQWFFHMYRRLGFEGCSSHSGRRTAITKWARNISACGGSMRDVQQLARHSSLSMTQRYVETDLQAMRKVVG